MSGGLGVSSSSFVPRDLSLQCRGLVLSSNSEPGKSTPAFCAGLEAPPPVKAHGEVASWCCDESRGSLNLYKALQSEINCFMSVSKNISSFYHLPSPSPVPHHVLRACVLSSPQTAWPGHEFHNFSLGRWKKPPIWYFVSVCFVSRTPSALPHTSQQLTVSASLNLLQNLTRFSHSTNAEDLP